MKHCSISTTTTTTTRDKKKRKRKKEKPNHKLNQINAEKFVSIKRLGDVIYIYMGTFGIGMVSSAHKMCVFSHQVLGISKCASQLYIYKQIYFLQF